MPQFFRALFCALFSCLVCTPSYQTEIENSGFVDSLWNEIDMLSILGDFCIFRLTTPLRVIRSVLNIIENSAFHGAGNKTLILGTIPKRKDDLYKFRFLLPDFLPFAPLNWNVVVDNESDVLHFLSNTPYNTKNCSSCTTHPHVLDRNLNYVIRELNAHLGFLFRICSSYLSLITSDTGVYLIGDIRNCHGVELLVTRTYFSHILPHFSLQSMLPRGRCNYFVAMESYSLRFQDLSTMVNVGGGHLNSIKEVDTLHVYRKNLEIEERDTSLPSNPLNIDITCSVAHRQLEGMGMHRILRFSYFLSNSNIESQRSKGVGKRIFAYQILPPEVYYEVDIYKEYKGIANVTVLHPRTIDIEKPSYIEPQEIHLLVEVTVEHNCSDCIHSSENISKSDDCRMYFKYSGFAEVHSRYTVFDNTKPVVFQNTLWYEYIDQRAPSFSETEGAHNFYSLLEERGRGVEGIDHESFQGTFRPICVLEDSTLSSPFFCSFSREIIFSNGIKNDDWIVISGLQQDIVYVLSTTCIAYATAFMLIAYLLLR